MADSLDRDIKAGLKTLKNIQVSQHNKSVIASRGQSLMIDNVECHRGKRGGDERQVLDRRF
jgi:hypothetical protein